MYALLGATLKHSLSPQIHAFIFRELGITGEYTLLELNAPQLKEAIGGREYQGFNVTIPYKQEVMQYLDELSPEAEQIGAVNTIKYTADKIIGYNTDYLGFGNMLEANDICVTGKNVVILGLGGSTKTVASYMQNNQAKNIYVASRSAEGKQALPGTKLINYAQLDTLTDLDIVVNATPCGMYPNIDAAPISSAQVAKFKVAVDLIYNPAQTLFLKYAREHGLVHVNGLRMLVAQAVYAQEIWQEQSISADSVQKILTEIGARYEG